MDVRDTVTQVAFFLTAVAGGKCTLAQRAFCVRRRDARAILGTCARAGGPFTAQLSIDGAKHDSRAIGLPAKRFKSAFSNYTITIVSRNVAIQ